MQFLAPMPSLFADTSPDRRRRRPLSDRPVLTPEDERSLLSKAWGVGLSGLERVGSVLDLPGSMVRDVIGGENPFDQLLSPTSPQNRLEGRDLLRKWGLAGDEDNWKNMLGGLGVDVALDPLTWLTFGTIGGLSPAGRAARRAGMLDDLMRVGAKKLPGAGKRELRMRLTPRDILQAADKTERQAMKSAFKAATPKLSGPERKALLDQPLGGLFGVRAYPFGSPFWTARGPASQKVGRWLDALGERIRYSAPARTLAGAFHAPMMGAMGEKIQRSVSRLFHRGLPEQEALARQKFPPLAEAAKAVYPTGETNVRQLRSLMHAPADDLESVAAAIAREQDVPIEAVLNLRRVAHEGLEQTYQQARSRGVAPKRWIDPEADYYPSYGWSGIGGDASAPAKTFSTMTESRLHREPYLAGIKDRANTINDVWTDADVNKALEAGGAEAARDVIESKYASKIPAYFYTEKKARQVKKLRERGLQEGEILAEVPPDDTYQAIAEAIGRSPADIRRHGPFPSDPLVDLTRYHTTTGRSVARADFSLEQLGQHLSPPGTPLRPGEGKTLESVLTELGIDPRIGARRIMQQRGVGIADPAEMKAALKQVVPREVADDLLKISDRISGPKSVQEIGKAINSANNLWKAFVVATPRFHGRNISSGQVAAAAEFGLGPMKETPSAIMMGMGKTTSAYVDHAGLRKYYREKLRRAHKSKEEIVEALRNLTPEQSTDLMREYVMVYQPQERYAGEVLSRIGPSGEPDPAMFRDMLADFPGGYAGMTAPKTKGWGTKIRGVGDATETTFPWLKESDMIGQGSEYLNRVPSFIHLTRRGVDPLVAKRMVDRLQVAYGGRHYTPAENQLLRLFPFGKFTKGMVQQVGGKLSNEPGGRLGQLIRAATRLKGTDHEDMLPEHIRQTMAVNIPEGTPLIGPPEGQGISRYLAGFGLMHEDPLEFVGPPKDALMEALSRTSPLFKMPLEVAAQRTFFQRGPMGGRDLQDMDPLIGRTLRNIQQTVTGETGSRAPVQTHPGLEHLAANLPWSPHLAYVRTAFDPRKSLGVKAMNLMTGARFADVSPEAKRALLDETLQKMIRSTAGARVFTKPYIPKSVLAEMPEDERLEALRLTALQNMLSRQLREEAMRKRKTSR